MYQDASAGGSNSNKTSNSADQAAQALDLMVKALQILDDGDIDPVVGARLDHAIEILREEIGRTS